MLKRKRKMKLSFSWNDSYLCVDLMLISYALIDFNFLFCHNIISYPQHILCSPSPTYV